MTFGFRPDKMPSTPIATMARAWPSSMALRLIFLPIGMKKMLALPTP